MFAIKYKTEGNDWVVQGNFEYATQAVTNFALEMEVEQSLTQSKECYVLLGLGIPVLPEIIVDEHEMGAFIVEPRLHGLTADNIPEPFKDKAVFGEYKVIIKKMSKSELAKFPEHEDFFDWLKQKIANTTNVPEGFALPEVSKDSIHIISQAKITTNPTVAGETTQ